MNETELLFTEILGLSRAQLYLEKDRVISREDCLRISRALKRRFSGEPIQYILGKTEFMGLEFEVNPDVLIPQPDTEVLVESALKQITNSVTYSFSRPEILDLGTGSGCIAVSLARSLSQARIVAVDISQPALNTAETNARKNGVSQSIEFLNSDLFGSPRLAGNSFDLIISNPPYVKTGVIQELDAEVRSEPRIALDGGEDGLDFYRRIFRESSGYLKRGGILMLEMGFDQKNEVEEIIRRSQIFEVKEVIKDYNNIQRVIVAGFKP